MKKALSRVSSLFLGAALASCAHTVPAELEHARTAYERANQSAAARLAPAELHEARTALETAENAFEDDPGAPVTRDLAYVALRRAQLAEVTGLRAQQARIKERATKAVQLAHAREAAEAQRALAQTQAELSAAQQSAEEAERAKQELSQRLSQIGQVREDERGTVLSLSGSVLFPSSKATLTPAAERRLRELGEALKNDPQRRIRVEGFTDARGSDAFNLQLSQQRAEAVRSYLVSNGLPPDRIEAEGKGEAQPIASNDDPEGRANNRRVEVVLEPRQ